MLAAGNMCAAREASHSVERGTECRADGSADYQPRRPGEHIRKSFPFSRTRTENLRAAQVLREAEDRGAGRPSSEGDPGTSLFAVCSGTVQMTALSTSGKNAVFNLIREGEIFGEIALLDGGPAPRMPWRSPTAH